MRPFHPTMGAPTVYASWLPWIGKSEASIPPEPLPPAPATSATAAPEPLLATGARGDVVERVQREVGATPDGIYGPQTAAKVAAYQRAHGLDADGMVGADTWHALDAASAALPAPVADAPATSKAAAAMPAPALQQPVTAGADRSKAWSDATRGVNANLGDTESALHLYYEHHPELGGKPPADGTPQAAQLKGLHLWADSKTFAKTSDPAQTDWRHDDSRALYISAADKATALSMYEAQHPELAGAAPVAGTSQATGLHAFERYVAQNRYNATIDHALQASPTRGIDGKTLKSLLIEESGFIPDVGTNSQGFTGIAQLGSDLATVAQADDPLTAIPKAATTLTGKSNALEGGSFQTFGEPDAIERTRFVVGAYNGGERTIINSIGEAQRNALAQAKGTGLTGAGAETAANRSALHWSSIVAPTTDETKSPLYHNIPAWWGKHEKYGEIGTYATDIVDRATQ